MMRTLLFSLVLTLALSAFGKNYKTDIYEAFLVGDMNRWEVVLKQMEASYKSRPNIPLLEEIVEVQYGLIGYLIGSGQKKKADAELEKAIAYLDVLMAKNDRNARYWAYKSAFVGFKIGLAIYKAPFLGPKSFDYIDNAIELDKHNPYVLMEYANGRYYAPGFAGGDKDDAMVNFKKAIELLEADSAKMDESWYYLMSKSKYGNLLLEEGNSKAALRVFDEILRFEPRYTWVSEELKPNALKFQE